MIDNVVCDGSGGMHHVHSSKVVSDERRAKERAVACVCGKVMYQDGRQERTCGWLFVSYSCTCGNKDELQIDLRI